MVVMDMMVMVTDMVMIPEGLAVVAAASVLQAPPAIPLTLPAVVGAEVGVHLVPVIGKALVCVPLPILDLALTTMEEDVMALSLCPLWLLQQSLAAV